VVSNFFLEGLSLSRLVGFLKLACIDSSDVRRLQIDQYDEEDLESLAEEAIAFYKST